MHTKKKLIIFFCVVSSLSSALMAAPQRHSIVERSSVASDGTQGGGLSSAATISANGRYVTFQSDATNLISGDTNGFSDIFVRDTCTGVATGCVKSTFRASSVFLSQSNGNSYFPSLSADGRYIAFESEATNLDTVISDTNGFFDIYVYDSCLGGPGSCLPQAQRISISTAGTQPDNISFAPSISATGRFVAFASDATNLVSSDTNASRDIFIRDTCSGAIGCTKNTFRASVLVFGSQSNGTSNNPSLSATGRYVAFDSTASNLVSGDTNGAHDVFVYDTCFGVQVQCIAFPRRVSLSNTGAQATASSDNPAITPDGRFVAFESLASNLVAGDTNARRDIFLRDTCIGIATGCTPSTIRVSLASDGTEANNDSLNASISSDGRFVAFESFASNLGTGDVNGVEDVFVRDTCIGVSVGCTPSTVRVSITTGNTAQGGNGASLVFGDNLSADGRYVSFESEATDIIPADSNATRDVFLASTGFPPPSYSLAGVVNAASFSNFFPGGVVPGSIISVFGTDMAHFSDSALFLPLPTMLGGIKASFQTGPGLSVDAPMFFASSGQLNVQVPWVLAQQSNALMTLSDTGYTGQETLTIETTNPGIFTTDQSGAGQGAILIANTASLAAPTGAFPGSRPANRGEFVSIFCTGLGAVNNQPSTGIATPDASSTTITPVTVTIDGLPATVSFAGLAPGFVGLYQVNVQVPTGATVGDAVNLSLFAGIASNTVTIAVQ